MYNDDISLEKSIYMPNVLFGDAGACAVVGRPDSSVKSDFPAFEIGNMGAHYIKNTRHVLTIAVSEEHGLYYENSIKKELPVVCYFILFYFILFYFFAFLLFCFFFPNTNKQYK